MPPNRHQRGGWNSRGRGGPKLPAELRTEMGIEAGPSRKPYRPPSKPDRRDGADRARDEADRRPQMNRRSMGEEEKRPRKPTKRSAEEPIPNRIQSSKSKLDAPPSKESKKEPELRLPKTKTIDKEDQEIEWLEYMLRKEKGKGKAEEIDDDGLDDILDFTDLIGPGGAGLNESDEENSDESGPDDDQDELELDLEGDSDDHPDDGDDEEDQEEEPGNEDDAEDSSTDPKPPLSKPSAEALDVSASRYIPPHLRAAALKAKDEADTEKIEQRRKLERRIQGLLNKLSEANIESILGEIESLYRYHSRHDTTETITELVFTMISNRSNLLDSFVVLYATLIGALYRTVGLEFGAHFLTTLVKRYSVSKSAPSAPEEVPASIYETPDASKVSLNLLTLIAELYNAQVVSAKLIYDLVIGFIKAEQVDGAVMGEAETESLLKVLKVCGSRLRSDDPASLGDIVNLVNERIKGREKEMTVRARFMVETLGNLKSGKSKSKATGELDSVERMKKFLGGLGRKQRLLAHEPLNVPLADLLAENAKGKWWLVGAAWSGNPLVEHQEKKMATKPKKEDDLLELARKQGMNTDVRRTIFVTLLTSEDYVHACDRLSALRLTEVQQRECVRVALHCCAIESTYNPFYTLVLEHLVSLSHNHRYTLQYALWDFIRDLEGTEQPKAARKTMHRSGNVARAMAYIIARDTMDLTVLKAVDFTAARKMTRSFVSTLVTFLILSTQTSSPLFALPATFDGSALDKNAIRDVFMKALLNTDVAQGLSYILRRNTVPSKDVGAELDGAANDLVRRGLKIAQTALAQST